MEARPQASKGQLLGERHGWGQLRDDGRRARQPSSFLDSSDGVFFDLDFSRSSFAAATSSSIFFDRLVSAQHHFGPKL